jgi:hypothetical protein
MDLTGFPSMKNNDPSVPVTHIAKVSSPRSIAKADFCDTTCGSSLTDELYREKPCTFYGDDAHFFDGLAQQSCRKWDFDSFPVRMRPDEFIRGCIPRPLSLVRIANHLVHPRADSPGRTVPLQHRDPIRIFPLIFGETLFKRNFLREWQK